jgi:hypothetical protein
VALQGWCKRGRVFAASVDHIPFASLPLAVRPPEILLVALVKATLWCVSVGVPFGAVQSVTTTSDPLRVVLDS